MKLGMSCLALAFGLIVYGPAVAAPPLINYQGRLANALGQPITLPVNVTFTFWNAETGGATVGSWSDTDSVVPDNNGIYSTMIGDDPDNLIPAVVFSADEVWLNVRIGSENLVPRKRLVSVGFALQSADAAKLGGQPASTYMLATTDRWVNTTGDSMTGLLQMTGTIVADTISPAGRAIQGVASSAAAGATNFGGFFNSAGEYGEGVRGTASGSLGVGAAGYASGAYGIGVMGFCTATTGTSYAIWGRTLSSTGYAGYFDGRSYFSGNVGIGRMVPGSKLHVEGGGADVLLVTNTAGGRGAKFTAPHDTAVWAVTTDGYAGVDGVNSGSTGIGVKGNASATGDVQNYGGYFVAAGDRGRAVYGKASSSANFSANYGGYFEAAGDAGQGVYAIASGTGYKSNCGGYFEAAGNRGAGVIAHSTAVGDNYNYGGRFFAAGGRGSAVQGSATAEGDVANIGGEFIAAGDRGKAVEGTASAEGNVTNYGGYFIAGGDNGRGVYGSGKAYSFYATGTGVDYGPFTGAHEVLFAPGFPTDPKPGLIVVTAGSTQIRRDDTGRIAISSTLPMVRLANQPNDKAAFGVLVRELPLPEEHWYKPAADERFGVVNALGDGRVWVCDAAGPIEMGDYITTSAVPGYGQRQSDDLQHNYTVGKVTEAVDWNTVQETVEIQGKTHKVYLIAVVYTCG